MLDTAIAPVTPALRLPAPRWPLVAYDGTVWRAVLAGRNCGEWQLYLRTGQRQPVTVPARLCQFARKGA